MANGEVPNWIRVGAKCRWWSESQKSFHSIVVTSLDLAKKRVVVHFENDHRVWKTVPFSQIGGNGPLRPPSSEKEKASGIASMSGVASVKSGSASVPPTGSKEEVPKDVVNTKGKSDGTSTPPWYETLISVHGEEPKEDPRKKQEEMALSQERRRAAWIEAQKKQAEEEERARLVERKRREEAAEADRLRIVQKLQREREEESRRQLETELMAREEGQTRRMNAFWRQEEEERRVRREEERRQYEEDEQRRLQARFQEELASRPRVSFGVKMQNVPLKAANIPQGRMVLEEAPVEMQQQHDGQLDGQAWHGADFQSRQDAHEAAMHAMPTMAAMAAMAAMPGMSGMTAMSAMPAMPAMPTMPSMSSMPAMPTMPVMPTIPHMPTMPAMMTAPDMTAMAAPAANVATSVEPTQTASQYYGERMCAIYAQHNPTKLADVPALLSKYVGCEAEMYERICEKYHVEPEPPPPLLPNTHRDEMSPEPDQDRSSQRSSQRMERKVPRVSAAPNGGSQAMGYARKAASQQSPGKNPPSASSLMARFNSLLAPTEDETEVGNDSANAAHDGFNAQFSDQQQWSQHGAFAEEFRHDQPSWIAHNSKLEPDHGRRPQQQPVAREPRARASLLQENAYSSRDGFRETAMRASYEGQDAGHAYCGNSGSAASTDRRPFADGSYSSAGTSRHSFGEVPGAPRGAMLESGSKRSIAMSESFAASWATHTTNSKTVNKLRQARAGKVKKNKKMRQNLKNVSKLAKELKQDTRDLEMKLRKKERDMQRQKQAHAAKISDLTQERGNVKKNLTDIATKYKTEAKRSEVQRKQLEDAIAQVKLEQMLQQEDDKSRQSEEKDKHEADMKRETTRTEAAKHDKQAAERATSLANGRTERAKKQTQRDKEDSELTQRRLEEKKEQLSDAVVDFKQDKQRSESEKESLKAKGDRLEQEARYLSRDLQKQDRMIRKAKEDLRQKEQKDTSFVNGLFR